MKLNVQNLTIQFGALKAVDDLSFTVESGELMCLLGPSGCGKSTILNAIAGFLQPKEGRIYFDETDITKLSVEKRSLGMVFQNYALYPHMTAYENIAFPLQIQGVARAEIRRRVEEIAELTRITDILKRKPGQISGGQQQRVAISRALVKKPQLLLMDEPLSNLDACLRMEMRTEIRRIQQDTGTTTIFVTHDQEEATSISDRIILLKNGVLQQMGSPYQLYVEPGNTFVASFLGTPPINFLEATCENDIIQLAQGTVRLHTATHRENGVYLVGIRCEDICLCPEERAMARLEILSTELLGKEALVCGGLGEERVRFLIPHGALKGLKKWEFITVHPENLTLFDAVTHERIGGIG